MPGNQPSTAVAYESGIPPPDCRDLAPAALTLTGVGIWEVRFDGRAPRWSAAIYELLGEVPYVIAPASARFDRSVHPDDFATVRHARRVGVRDGGSYVIVYRLCIGGATKRIQEHGVMQDGEAGERSQLRVLQDVSSRCDAANAVENMAVSGASTSKASPAEDAARRLAAIVRNSPHYIGYADLEGKIQFVNEAGLRMLGPPATEVYGSNSRRFFEEPDRSYFDEFVLPSVMVHGTWTGDIRIRNQISGTDTWVHGIVFRIDDEITGEPLHVAAVAQDVTELRLAEAQLAAANRKLQTVLLSCPVVLWSAEPDGTIHLAQGRDLTSGAAPSESFIGINLFDRFAHDKNVQAALRKAQNGKPAEVECEIDGRIFHQRVTPVFDVHGTVVSITGVSIDITDSRLAQRELNRAYAVTRAIMSAVRDIMYVTDANFRLRWWNPRAEEILALDGGTLRDRHVADLVDSADALRIREALARVMRDGSASLEANVRLRDGMVPHHHVVVRMHDENGIATGICGIARDATEQTRSRDELERLVESRTRELNSARLRAEASANAKSEFLSRMSHELRTPLNAILGFAQLLSSDVEQPLSKEQREDVAFIESAGHHLLMLINEVLDLSRFEREAHAIELTCVDLAGELANCVAMLQPLADEREIDVELSAGACEVRGELTRLRQVLLNLLSNAIKYNRPGGSVRLAWTAGEPGRVRLCVSDTGPGIPADVACSLFEPFVRCVDTERFVEGSGIGLAIAKSLVEQMGGAIGVDSECGRGATFWIELPGTLSQAETYTVT